MRTGTKIAIGVGGPLTVLAASVFTAMVYDRLVDTNVCQRAPHPHEYLVYSHHTGKTLVTMRVTQQNGQKNLIGPAVLVSDPSPFAPASPLDTLEVRRDEGMCRLHLYGEGTQTIQFPLLSGIKGP